MVHGYARSKSRARVTNELIGDCWEECAEACEMCCEEACGCCGITAWGIFLTVFASMLMCCCWTKQTGVIGVLLWIVVVIGDIIFVPAIVMAMGGACVCVYVCVVGVKCSAPPPNPVAVARGLCGAAERRLQQRPSDRSSSASCVVTQRDSARRCGLMGVAVGAGATAPRGVRAAASWRCAAAPPCRTGITLHTHTHTLTLSPLAIIPPPTADAARASNWKAPIVMILGTIIGVVVIIRGSVAIALITQIAAVGYRPARELPWRAWALRVQESQSGKLKQGGTMEKVLQRASGFKASGV